MNYSNKKSEWNEIWNQQTKWWNTIQKIEILENIQQNKEKEEIDKLFEYENKSGMIAPVIVLLKKMRQKIENGEYTAILGIDWSGRLPALLFAEILKNIYQLIGINKEIKQYFVAWNRNPNRQYINQFGGTIDKKTDNPYTFLKERCLVVDDWFFSGETLEKISKSLSGKIPFDIVALHLAQSWSESYDMERMKQVLKNNFAYWLHWKPDYYGKNNLHGLAKNRKYTTNQDRIIVNNSFISKVQEWRDMELIGYVRRKIKKAAKDIANNFIHPKSP